eukprot:1235414-Pyramimonas_sp.AAC.1
MDMDSSHGDGLERAVGVDVGLVVEVAVVGLEDVELAVGLALGTLWVSLHGRSLSRLAAGTLWVWLQGSLEVWLQGSWIKQKTSKVEIAP